MSIPIPQMQITGGKTFMQNLIASWVEEKPSLHPLEKNPSLATLVWMNLGEKVLERSKFKAPFDMSILPLI